eukprot:XP_020397681.1 uncharacterized protein LOC103637749 [Zea mays]
MSEVEANAGGGGKEQDRFLPVANIGRIMRRAVLENGKIARDARESIQECVSEFIRPTELPAPSTPSARPKPVEPPRLRSTPTPKAEPSNSLRITAATPTRPAAEPKTPTGISTARPERPGRDGPRALR